MRKICVRGLKLIIYKNWFISIAIEMSHAYKHLLIVFILVKHCTSIILLEIHFFIMFGNSNLARLSGTWDRLYFCKIHRSLAVIQGFTNQWPLHRYILVWINNVRVLKKIEIGARSISDSRNHLNAIERRRQRTRIDFAQARLMPLVDRDTCYYGFLRWTADVTST